MTMLFSLPFRAAQQTDIRLVAELEDGSKVVEIGGVKYRALTAQQTKDYLHVANERDEARADLKIEKEINARNAEMIKSFDSLLSKTQSHLTEIDSTLLSTKDFIKRFDGQLQRHDQALTKVLEANQEAKDLMRGGRIRQFRNNQFVGLAEDYLAKPAMNGFWNKLAGCR